MEGSPVLGSDDQAPDDELWSMGAASRRTGIGEHTLRAWERRFGFPMPVRLPSGHRRYTAADVRRLLLIAAALGRGHRAGDVVPMPQERLEALVARSGGADEGQAPARWIDEQLEAARRFDADALAAALRLVAGQLGLPRYLNERLQPFLEAVGEAWSEGRLDIRHEHLVSQVVEDQLRGERAMLERAARGRPVVLATLPEERHGLGLQMVALATVLAGRAVRSIGLDTPVDEIVSTCAAVHAAAVGLSVSVPGATPATAAAVRELRAAMPRATPMWLGGAGASRLEQLPDGVTVLDDLGAVAAAVAALPAP